MRLTATIYPCLTARQRQCVHRVEQMLELGKTEQSMGDVLHRIQLLRRQRMFQHLSATRVDVAHQAQVNVYESGRLSMTITPVQQ